MTTQHLRSGRLPSVFYALAALMAALLTLPFIALLWRLVGIEPFALSRTPILDALLVSMRTTTISVVLVVALGTPLAYALARFQFPGKRLISALVEVPIVMPPVVAGLALLLAFGRRGLIGASLVDLGLMVIFTPAAVIITQVFVSAPFYIRAAQTRFAAVPRDLEEAARIDGANEWLVFRHITLPLSLPALLTGLALAWARALGEFGATILFAGNLQGR
ncbi:MAG: molybdate ABC transporter permease subunit, partial [Chloroflexi bacterium]|nr:molybdate ABC transporter permease subunit [Chloroflexota bacterium]